MAQEPIVTCYCAICLEREDWCQCDPQPVVNALGEHHPRSCKCVRCEAEMNFRSSQAMDTMESAGDEEARKREVSRGDSAGDWEFAD